MARNKEKCRLIRLAGESCRGESCRGKSQNPFEQKLKNSAPLMYRSLLDPG